MKTLLIAAALCVAAFTVQLHAADSFLASVELSPYGTIGFAKLGGKATLGAGVSLSHSLWKNVGIRLSAEADSWKPEDYVIDRAWSDITISANLGSKHVKGYGFGGFGYSRETGDVLARAGLGLKSDLVSLGRVHFGPFVEGALEASTGDYHGARLSAGFNLGF